MPQGKKLKPSEKIAFGAIGFGVAAGFGLAWLMPGAHWGVYTVFGVIVAAGGFGGASQAASEQKVIDKDHD